MSTTTGRGVPYTGHIEASRPTALMLTELIDRGYTSAAVTWPQTYKQLKALTYREAEELIRYHRSGGDWATRAGEPREGVLNRLTNDDRRGEA